MIGRNHGNAHTRRVGTRYVLALLVAVIAVVSFVVLLRFGRYHGGESEDIFLAARMSFRERRFHSLQRTEAFSDTSKSVPFQNVFRSELISSLIVLFFQPGSGV